MRCVGAVVHDGSRRLLLVLRGHAPSAGRWSLPGGRVEPGETDAEAVTREVREETGLAVTVGRHCGAVLLANGDIRYDVHDYLCTVTGGAARAGDDAAALTWCDAARFAALERAGELTDGLAATLRSWHVLPWP